MSFGKGVWRGFWRGVWIGAWVITSPAPACDFTTYFNGVELVNDPFVNGEPATGPIKIDAIGATNDAITSITTLDPAQDETFSVNTTLLGYTFSADVLFTFIDTLGPSYIRAQYISGTGQIYMEGHDGTNYSYMNSDTSLLLNENHSVGLRLSGVASNKLITMVIDGVDQTSTDNLDFTGVTFDRIVVATSGNSGSRLKLLLYYVNSLQLGDTNFVGRLPSQNDTNGNKFFSDAPVPVVWELTPQAPFTEHYPYYDLGLGWPNAYYVSDTYCGNCNLSNYWNGSSNDTIGFTGLPAVPATGPMRFASVTPANAITADIIYDPNIDDLFTSGIDYLVDFVQFNDTFFTLYNAANTEQFINVFYTYSGANRILRVQAKDGVTVYTTQLLNEMIAGTKSNIGFDSAGVGSAKTIRAYSDGVYATDGKIVDWTGITFDKIVYGVSKTMTGDSFPMDLYYSNSAQLGYANFTTRLPTKDSVGTIIRNGITYTVNGPEFYPYLGEFYPLKIAYMGDSIFNQYDSVDYITTALNVDYPNAVHTRYAQNGYTASQLASSTFDYGAYLGGRPADLTRNIDKVIEDGNDIIVLYVGVNDNLLGYPKEGVIGAHQDIIDHATDAGKIVIVLTMMSSTSTYPTENAYSNDISVTMRTEWSGYSNVYIGDINIAMGLGGLNNYVDFPTLTTDTVHPTIPAGEIAEADVVTPILQSVIPNAVWSSPSLESDTPCAGNSIMMDDIITNTALYDEVTGEFMYNEEV